MHCLPPGCRAIRKHSQSVHGDGDADTSVDRRHEHQTSDCIGGSTIGAPCLNVPHLVAARAYYEQLMRNGVRKLRAAPPPSNARTRRQKAPGTYLFLYPFVGGGKYSRQASRLQHPCLHGEVAQRSRRTPPARGSDRLKSDALVSGKCKVLPTRSSNCAINTSSGSRTHRRRAAAQTVNIHIQQTIPTRPERTCHSRNPWPDSIAQDSTG